MLNLMRLVLMVYKAFLTSNEMQVSWIKSEVQLSQPNSTSTQPNTSFEWQGWTPPSHTPTTQLLLHLQATQEADFGMHPSRTSGEQPSPPFEIPHYCIFCFINIHTYEKTCQTEKLWKKSIPIFRIQAFPMANTFELHVFLT